MMIFLQKMDLLLKKTSVDDMKRHILPMILHSLESNSSQVQVSHTPLCVSDLYHSLLSLSIAGAVCQYTAYVC